ncbi:hypothetical protein MMC28_008017 [Mycoblastus sanguinarius]|nr:hypothetical protein [Mycoblastus sanguinarius]
MASLSTPTAVPSPKLHKARSASTGYGTLTTVTNGSIVRATINNPPVNLWDYKLAADFSTFLGTLAQNANTSDVKVVILSSANPDFFIDHIDIHALSAASPESPPGTRSVQFLVSLIGRARALEYILSARSVDAIEAAAIGWVNRAFSSEIELESEVTALAERIATFPKQGLAAIKSRVNIQKPSEDAIMGDNSLFTQLEKSGIVQQSQDRYLVLSANESANTFEKDIPQDLPAVLT